MVGLYRIPSKCCIPKTWHWHIWEVRHAQVLFSSTLVPRLAQQRVDFSMGPSKIVWSRDGLTGRGTEGIHLVFEAVSVRRLVLTAFVPRSWRGGLGGLALRRSGAFGASLFQYILPTSRTKLEAPHVPKPSKILRPKNPLAPHST